MKCAIGLCLLMSVVLPAQIARREAVYPGAVTLAGQVVPLFANATLSTSTCTAQIEYGLFGPIRNSRSITMYRALCKRATVQ